MKFVSALNAVHDNIWSLVIIGAGVALIIHHQETAGSTLVTLGAAVFRTQALTNKPDVPAPSADPDPTKQG